jgi:cell division protein FtsB
LFRNKYNSIRNEFYGLAGEPEIDLEEENMRLKIEVSDLKKEIKKLNNDLKEAISNNIQPRNQQTKVYYASEGISASIY